MKKNFRLLLSAVLLVTLSLTARAQTTAVATSQKTTAFLLREAEGNKVCVIINHVKSISASSLKPFT
jgi:hypothetical protein